MYIFCNIRSGLPVYFLYRTNSCGKNACSPAKILKKSKMNFVSVVSYSSGNWCCFERKFYWSTSWYREEGIFWCWFIIHIVFVIAHSDLRPYSLTSSKFENITIFKRYMNTSGVRNLMHFSINFTCSWLKRNIWLWFSVYRYL